MEEIAGGNRIVFSRERFDPHARATIGVVLERRGDGFAITFEGDDGAIGTLEAEGAASAALLAGALRTAAVMACTAIGIEP